KGDRSLPAELRVLHPRGRRGRPHGGAGARIGDRVRGGPVLLWHEREGADFRVPGRPREARVPGARQSVAGRTHRRRACKRTRPNGEFVMHEGGTIDRFIDATFAVPTRSEAYKYAAYDGLMRLERRVRPKTAD